MLQESFKTRCRVCEEKFNHGHRLPKILTCKHIYCSDCLSSLVLENKIKCPLKCNVITHLSSGVSGNFF